MTRLFVAMGASLAIAGLLFLSTAADAQSNNTGAVSNSSSSRMWGSAGPNGNATDSATMHALDGNSAGQVNAAKQGLLLNGGPGMSITSIGSQNIVSSTIVGDNNSINVNANQNSTNSGSVSNQGTITSR